MQLNLPLVPDLIEYLSPLLVPNGLHHDVMLFNIALMLFNKPFYLFLVPLVLYIDVLFHGFFKSPPHLFSYALSQLVVLNLISHMIKQSPLYLSL